MKQKTSITLSSDVLKQIDRLAGSELSRSGAIEAVLRAYFRQKERQRLNQRDLELINAAADSLNAQAADVLEYQSIDD